MDTKTFITRQLERAKNKRFENYVITRIWHKLDDVSIKFLTQQYVIRPNGRALTDLFLPQIGLHIEVDEAQHFKRDGTRKANDLAREKDIICASKYSLKRVKVDGSESLTSINAQVDEIIDHIRAEIDRRKKDGSFKAWDLDAEFAPKTYISRGYIDTADCVAFKRIVDACNCFGHRYEGYQRAFAKHGVDSNYRLWFPKFNSRGKWVNDISPKEHEIYEMPKTPITRKGVLIRCSEDYLKWVLNNSESKLKRIVFAYAKDSLGEQLYRFKGVYQFDEKRSREDENRVVYKRITDRVETHPQPEL